MTVHTRQTPLRRPRRSWAVHADRGSVAVEIALGAPLVVLLLFLLTAAVQLGRAAIDVNAAAAAASRAASLSRAAAAATAAAHTAAAANLAGRCATVAVDVDTTAFRRGGAVTVTVACTVTTHGLTGISIPGSVTTTAQSTSPVDVWRSKALGFTNSEASSSTNRSMGGA